jgi:protein ImuA
MSSVPRLRPVDSIHLPYVWRVDDLALEEETLPTGHPSLNAQLPGGGWPVGSLIEILQPRSTQHVWQLLLPGLVGMLSRQAGPVVLIGAPLHPFVPSLKSQGLPAERLLCVNSEKPQARLWAAEQALRCAEVAAVLAWLPNSKSAELRRLNMAAQQHARLLFVFKGLNAMHDASPARLRLRVEGVDALQLQVLKRRGPPLATALALPAHCRKLEALLAARRASRRSSVAIEPGLSESRRSHVLDRIAAFT